MSDFNHPNDSDDDAELKGAHCDACNEWLDSSDTHCPTCGSAR